MLANRLAKNLRHWSRWARRQGLECYRVYHDDIPEYPLTAEIYGSFAVVHAPWPRREDLLDELHTGLDVDQAHLVLKDRGKRPGGVSHAPPGPDRRMTVDEFGLRFEVNLTAYHDTGLFLDHRLTRRMVRERSAGLSVLNLFCYTGSFSVYAAAGGARKVTSVDLSNTYLEWADRNRRLNGQRAELHEIVRADVLQWRSDERYDLIICDPPTFSNSKAMRATFDVGRDHPHLLAGCREHLAPGGTVLFSTNDQGFRPQFEGREITPQTVPEDFQRGRPPHRCWLLSTGDS